jgi:prolyl oligopeptidase
VKAPPPTAVHDVTEILHGVEVRDPYRWLEDESAPDVRAWTAAQGTYARSVLDALPGREAIAARLAEALDCGALGGTAPRGRRRFFARRTAGMDQAALYVADGDGMERTLVDPGPLSPDATTALDWWAPSEDGQLLCFGLSEAGSEDSTLRLLGVATGEWLEDAIPHCRLAAVAFEPGNAALLYTRYPAAGTVPDGEEHYHRHVWRHVVGEDPASDLRVFGEGRDRLDYPASISFSGDGRWTVIVVSQGWDRTAVFLRDGAGRFNSIFEGIPSELHAWFAGERLLAVTNFGAPRYRLVEIDPTRPQSDRWHDLVPESEHVLSGAVLTGDRIAVHHLVNCHSRVSLYRSEGAFESHADLPPFSSVTGLGGHHTTGELFLTVETFTQPATSHRLGGGEVGRLEPPPGFDRDRYPVRQVRFPSRDGTRVPMFLVGRSEGGGPTVLTGYGGFNISRTPLWMATAVPFLEAGGLVAVANLRGGGEFGEAWHRAGMLGHKQNVFDDFEAAAEYLIAAGLTTPSQLGILGGSNGGLLVGAAMTQRPDLFGCVICRVPLLDMVRYERFKVARLWAAEYGTAGDPEQLGWLHAYSPYHRVREGVRYPPTLITTGDQDARVDPMHARKMAARLQAAAPDTSTLLRVEPRAGHGQGKPATKMVPEEADVWAFLLAQLA